MFDLTGKFAVVVGAASGIGRAIAVAYAEQGASVDCLDIDEAGCHATAQSIEALGGKVSSAPLDVRDSGAVEAAMGELVSARGRMDIAVCTPGINIRKPMLRYTDADYDAVTDVNLRGSFNVMRAVGRIMYEQRSGSIIVISSISSRVVEPGQVIYAGTKAALAAMVRVLAAELGPYGVRVNAIAPGPIETELTVPIRSDQGWQDAYASRVAAKRWGQPAEIAAPAVFLASDEASFVSGAQLFADGGWTDIDQRYQGGPIGGP